MILPRIELLLVVRHPEKGLNNLRPIRARFA